MTKLNTLNIGELKIGGYPGSLIDYTVDYQLLDQSTWAIFVDQFRVRDDNADNGWRGEFFGKMMRGASLTYKATKNEKLYKALEEAVKDILTTEDEYGRISSYKLDNEFHGWDMWSRKYVILGLEYFLEICKSNSLKNKIIRSLKHQANYIVKHIGESRNKTSIFETSNFWGCLNSCSILEPFVKLYNLTQDEKYLKFSEYLISSGFCKDMNLIELCLTKELYPYQFKYTKAYEMMSCFEGLLEYYKIKGNSNHLKAVENFVDMVKETDYTIIGCSGCLHELFDNSSLVQTESPKEEIMQETCVTVTFLKLCSKLYLITGNEKYISLIEKSSFNALYGSVNNRHQDMHRSEARKWIGDDIIYFKHEPFPFDSYSPLYQDRRAKRVGGFKELQNGRSYGCCACIGSAGTAISGLVSLMKENNSFVVNIYSDFKASTKYNDSKVTFNMKATPYKDNAKLKINGNGKEFSVKFRVPEWALNFEIYINNEKQDLVVNNGYASISRTWNNDLVSIKYKTKVIMHVLNNKVAFTKGVITLARDSRFEDITKPLDIKAKDLKIVSYKQVKNDLFDSNLCLKIKTNDGYITLVDYSEAGKNYDDDSCNITVWQVVK